MEEKLITIRWTFLTCFIGIVISHFRVVYRCIRQIFEASTGVYQNQRNHSHKDHRPDRDS